MLCPQSRLRSHSYLVYVMKQHQLGALIAAMLCSSLISCKSIANQVTEPSVSGGDATRLPKVGRRPSQPTISPAPSKATSSTQQETKTESRESASSQSRRVSDSEKKRIFAQVLAQDGLGLCDQDQPEASEIYTNGQGQYLVKVMCFMAAYQGSYEFVLAERDAKDQLEIKHAGVALAGYPTLDPKTNILSNDYKLNGAGTCIESSQYHWDGYELRLVSSVLQDGVENGCQDLGVRSPSSKHLITATRVGDAQLGMTLGELRQRLPAEAQIEPVQLGVDMPPGMRVSFGPAVQYDLAFDRDQEQSITDQSQIEWIIARHPQYQTAEGVGPGTLVKDAATEYGPATLGYSHENESREFIKFDQEPFSTGPETRVWIRSNQWTVTDFAGLYPNQQSQSYFETQRYRDHAAIASIAIYKSPRP